MKTKQIIQIIQIMLALFLGASASAQDTLMYRGGKGDGYQYAFSNSFSNAILASNVPYAGGKGDGFAFEREANFTPSPLNNNTVYAGNKGDGHAVELLNNFAPILLNNNVAYLGNKGDGHATVRANLFTPVILNNNVAYLGSVGDGHAQSGFASFNRTFINNYYAYAGGAGDGWSNELAQSVSLPLVLLSFEGQAMGDHNMLNWKTSIEENVDYFLVEKSKDGVDFADIGTVNAVGHSTTEQSYDYKDVNEVQGINYYKLRMTDIDNSYQYSKVIKLINEKLDYSVVLAPNPAKDKISIRLSRALETTSQFTVLDMTGKVILKKTIGKDEAVKNIDIQSLVPGQYMIYLNLANDMMSLPFIKK